MKIIRLNAGDKFGDLTVLGPAPASPKYPKQRMWKCRCICGELVEAPATHLVQGHRTSCGRHCTKSRLDVTGQRYGRLVALEPTGEIRDENAVWKWQCDCGNVIEATLEQVRWDKKRSCGCARKEANSKCAIMAQQGSLRVENTDLAKIASQELPRNNQSGCKGVHFDNKHQRWKAVIGFQGRRIYLGYYTNLEDAIAARKEAEKKYYAPMLEKHKDMLKK